MSYTFTKFREAEQPPQSRFGRLGRWVRGHRTMVATAAGISAVALGVAAVAGVPLAGAAETDVALPGTIRASAFAEQSGAQTEGTADAGGGKNVGWLAGGDWLRYNGVDLGAAGPVTASVRVAAAYADRTGSVEIHLDSTTGPVLATVPVTGTGGWQSWKTSTAAGTSPGGRHDVYLVLKSGQKQDFVNLNWFGFAGTGSSASPSGSPSVSAPGSASPSASTPAAPVPSTSSAAAAPATGWIPVDQAKWQAQLDAFNATVPQAPPAGRGRNPEFNATCTYSHSGQNDPIVFPGMPGASHMHSFFGNRSTNANTTTDSLFQLTDTTCNPVEDHSAYWMPTLTVDGKAVESNMFIVYYGSLMADTTKTLPMPNGLRMLQGDSKKQVATPVGAVNQFYCSGGPLDGRARSADGNFPICGDGGTVHFTMRFADCWDGKNLDSPNHKDHVTNGANNTCPPSHPVRIPAVTLSIYFPTAGGTDMKLSSGLASSMHADGFFVWDVDAMNKRVKNCVIQAVACKSNGDF
ncbi:DUF1996 domain-containing protein [Catenuloplanes sp. NPDC051500]|uniref:DUF1996 domain-containing protein n=1 Tax=Catenuloplanes sp. NPDC051500 TaxID=3363959 RepID=UPI0037AAB314